MTVNVLDFRTHPSVTKMSSSLLSGVSCLYVYISNFLYSAYIENFIDVYKIDPLFWFILVST